MRIGLDARNDAAQGGTGIATYARTIAEACALEGMDVSWLSGTSGREGRAAPLIRLGQALATRRGVRRIGAGYRVCGLYRAAIVRYRNFSRMTELRGDRPPAVMHWTCPLPIRWEGVPNVVTIHDLIPLLHPSLAVTAISDFGRFLQECCDKAEAVVTVSEAVRADILSCLKVAPEKVVNLSQAVTFDAAILDAARKAPLICPQGGFVYFGTLERRKNVARLIRAHALSGSTRCLTLIGAFGHGKDEILRERYRHPHPEWIRLLPWADRESLIGVMIGARAVVFPSLAEGFGLPIAEAMALGVPVLTSAGHATEEVAGGAGLLVAPEDTGAMAEALRALDCDDELVETLRLRGLERASAFSMPAFAARLANFYRGLTVG